MVEWTQTFEILQDWNLVLQEPHGHSKEFWMIAFVLLHSICWNFQLLMVKLFIGLGPVMAVGPATGFVPYVWLSAAFLLPSRSVKTFDRSIWDDVKVITAAQQIKCAITSCLTSVSEPWKHGLAAVTCWFIRHSGWKVRRCYVYWFHNYMMSDCELKLLLCGGYVILRRKGFSSCIFYILYMPSMHISVVWLSHRIVFEGVNKLQLLLQTYSKVSLWHG